jgi:hypothetical protein
VLAQCRGVSVLQVFLPPKPAFKVPVLVVHQLVVGLRHWHGAILVRMLQLVSDGSELLLLLRTVDREAQ